MKKVVIVGGGTAGWMTALIMARKLTDKGFQIELLESPDVGIIGVGEGSTPAMKLFFDSQDIAESEWMPECNATYKCGIKFVNWSTRPGYESYFHPFSSALDGESLQIFKHNTHARLRGADVHAHPDRYFVTSRLARECLSPVAPENFPFNVDYGYHFDAALLGQFLRKKAIERGVIHRVCHIEQVLQDDAGNIAGLLTDAGETHAADLFVDCTGFASILLQKTLKTPFISYSNTLLNDAAVAMPSDIDKSIPSETVSTALKHGWAWKIPLTNRYGNGYVYSSAFCSADEAEHELRERLGFLDADIPVRHLKMKIGRVQEHWVKNCLAVGLSQGFIEPLEATALLLVQKTADLFVHHFSDGEFTDRFRKEFNERVNSNFDGVRDYIVTHYKISTRSDTEYWRANKANQQDVTAPIRELYGAWFKGKDLAKEIQRLNIVDSYPVPSWYCIFAGMGVMPNAQQVRKATPEEGRYDLTLLDDFFRRCALNYTDHRTYLNQLANGPPPV
jgi:2-polyprenyl-6-methoxyphenol hydroxylase-like FAD-dependent oxidoreductase